MLPPCVQPVLLNIMTEHSAVAGLGIVLRSPVFFSFVIVRLGGLWCAWRLLQWGFAVPDLIFLVILGCLPVSSINLLFYRYKVLLGYWFRGFFAIRLIGRQIDKSGLLTEGVRTRIKRPYEFFIHRFPDYRDRS